MRAVGVSRGSMRRCCCRSLKAFVGLEMSTKREQEWLILQNPTQQPSRVSMCLIYVLGRSGPLHLPPHDHPFFKTVLTLLPMATSNLLVIQTRQLPCIPFPQPLTDNHSLFTNYGPPGILDWFSHLSHYDSDPNFWVLIQFFLHWYLK